MSASRALDHARACQIAACALRESVKGLCEEQLLLYLSLSYTCKHSMLSKLTSDWRENCMLRIISNSDFVQILTLEICVKWRFIKLHSSKVQLLAILSFLGSQEIQYVNCCTTSEIRLIHSVLRWNTFIWEAIFNIRFLAVPWINITIWLCIYESVSAI